MTTGCAVYGPGWGMQHITHLPPSLACACIGHDERADQEIQRHVCRGKWRVSESGGAGTPRLS